MKINHYISSLTVPEAIDGQMILLDVETTGLSPEMSALFMIGCGWFEDQKLHMIQWLADSLELFGEQDILKGFSQWLFDFVDFESSPVLITYNGTKFDLPFLNSRYEQCGLLNPLSALQIDHCDLYRKYLPLKKIWPVPNMKLKTLSQWMGYKFPAAPEGRKLIKTYHDYIKTKDPDMLNLLFLHNIDDIESLMFLLPMQGWLNFFHGDYEIAETLCTEQHKIRFKLKSFSPLKSSFEWEAYNIKLTAAGRFVSLLVPVYERGLRYYYTDYRNYVYLPAEDYALPKSMAKYMDRSYQEKACKENCYTWFLPDARFMQDKEKQREYIQMLFRLFGFL